MSEPMSDERLKTIGEVLWYRTGSGSRDDMTDELLTETKRARESEQTLRILLGAYRTTNDELMLTRERLRSESDKFKTLLEELSGNEQLQESDSEFHARICEAIS